MFKEFDVVRLCDGTVGTVMLVFGKGEAYEIEVQTPGGDHPYKLITVRESDIASIEKLS